MQLRALVPSKTLSVLSSLNQRVNPTTEINLAHNFDHNSVVCCVKFSADSKLLATGCNRSAHIFDVQSGALVW